MQHLFESENYEDEPLANATSIDDLLKKKKEIVYDDLDHKYTTHLEETFNTLIEWRQMVDKISQKCNSKKYYNNIN
jgi:hypothetical protein